MEWQEPEKCILYCIMRQKIHETQQENMIQKQKHDLFLKLPYEVKLQLQPYNTVRDLVVYDNRHCFQEWLDELCFKFITKDQRDNKHRWFELEACVDHDHAIRPLFTDFPREVARFVVSECKKIHTFQWFPTTRSIASFLQENSRKYPNILFYRVMCFLLNSRDHHNKKKLFLTQPDPRFDESTSTKGFQVLANEDLRYSLQYFREDPFVYTYASKQCNVWFHLYEAMDPSNIPV